jgi:hypothetical protein
MLKHHAGRIARRLSTLFMLVAVFAALASSPVEAAKNRPNGSTNKGPFCEREISPEGFCVEICCTGSGCMATSCG